MAGQLKVDSINADSNLALKIANTAVAFVDSTGLKMTGSSLQFSSGGSLTVAANNALVNPTITTPTINQLSSAAATALTIQSAGTTAITVDTSQNVGIGTTSPSRTLDVKNIVDYQIRVGYSGSSNYYDFGRSGSTGYLNFYGSQTGYTGYVFSGVDGERMRIDSSGNLLVGGTTTANLGTANRLGAFRVDTASRVYLQLAATDGASQTHIYCYNGAGLGGSIATSSGTISLVNASDYRVKNVISPIQNALETVDRLNPVVYEYKTTLGQYFDGFIAHELQEVVPTAVFGEKDAVNEEGEIKAQGVDLTRLVPTLVKAIQELKAINDQQAETINALTARIVALENK